MRIIKMFTDKPCLTEFTMERPPPKEILKDYFRQKENDPQERSEIQAGMMSKDTVKSK